MINYTYILSGYRSFVERVIQNYTSDYKAYLQAGGHESFFHRCWWLMMNETVEEANRLTEECMGAPADKVALLRQLQAIAEEHLLVIVDPVTV